MPQQNKPEKTTPATTPEPLAISTKPLAHTPGPWKVELDGTMSGNWLVIYVDDPSYDGGKRELFRSETLQTNANVRRNTLKQRWIDQPNAEEIRANAHLCAASWEMLEALKKADYRLTYIASQQQNQPEEYRITRTILDEIRAARIQAEGRQP